MRCSVLNCSNDTKITNKNHGITFHLFPKEPALRKVWIEALGSPESIPKEQSAICSEHFRKEDLYLTVGGMRKVKNGAVPVIIIKDSAEDLDDRAAFRVCRICLAMDTRLFDIREQNLDQYYLQITGIFVNDEGSLPQRVCWECANRLRSAASLREKALRAHLLLLEVSRTDSYLTIRDIKSINRTQNGLASSLHQSAVLKIYECNDLDLHIRETKVIKTEANDYNEYNEEYDDLKEPVDVKDESNEILLNEYNDFESDDEKKLSVLSSQVCNEKKVKVTKKRKVTNIKEKKNTRVIKTIAGEDSETTMDKYKMSYVKRRKRNEELDESLFTITPLTYEEQIAEVEKRKESNAYKNAVHKCTTCYRGFKIRERYEAHIVRHSEKTGMYECFICKTRYKATSTIRKHMKTSHTEQISCKKCPFATRNKCAAREHEKFHAGKKYRCPHCDMEFDKLTTYLGHLRIKHASDWVCALCGYTFVSRTGVDVHRRKKHRQVDENTPLEGPTCNVCEVQFASEEAHSRHLRLSSRHMTESDPNRLRNDNHCLNSERIGSDKRRERRTYSNRLRNDSQSMNAERNGRVMRRIERRPDAPRAITCEQCGVQLRDYRRYTVHFRRVHPGKNQTKYTMKTPIMCDLCGRIFHNGTHFKNHMWVHTGEKRYKCAVCPKSFSQKSNLVKHERAHSQLARPSFPCPICGKHFAYYSNRIRHMFIHKGLKPFKCTSCDKCFTTTSELRAHTDHVHLKKPWPRRARKDNMSGKKSAEP